MNLGESNVADWLDGLTWIYDASLANNGTTLK